MAYVHVDRPRVAVVGAVPKRLEQHPAAGDPPGLRGEGTQQLELHVGQLYGLSAHGDGAPWQVEHQGPTLDALLAARFRSCLGATEERAHAGAKLADREGLGDVVVGA